MKIEVDATKWEVAKAAILERLGGRRPCFLDENGFNSLVYTEYLKRED